MRRRKMEEQSEEEEREEKETGERHLLVMKERADCRWKGACYF
jgi:hypothetical protein